MEEYLQTELAYNSFVNAGGMGIVCLDFSSAFNTINKASFNEIYYEILQRIDNVEDA